MGSSVIFSIANEIHFRLPVRVFKEGEKSIEGKRKGQHSIRINDQWRICFLWQDKDVFDVEITDYH